MKIKFKALIAITLVLLIAVFASSCKKNKVKKVVVDTQFAVALFSDTVSLRQIITDMDSTTKTWLRVRNDSIFAFYVDTIKDVLKASDLLDNIEDVDFSTSTHFSLPPYDPTNNHDTILEVERFMTVPFNYEGYNIEEVLLRGGHLSFGFAVTPRIEHLRQLEVYSNELLTPEGEPLRLVIDYDYTTHQEVDLAGYHIMPDNDTVAFSANIYLHIDSGVYEGGDYMCDLDGGLTGVQFNTIYGTIEKPLDSIFNDRTAIDFGINGLSGSAVLPIPTIKLDYCNTFGLSAIGDITTLEFVNTSNGLVTDLLASEEVEVTVHPTQGQWRNTQIFGFTDEIDALAGYNRLDFGGMVSIGLNDQPFSISDTSTVDIAADIEMPFKFRLSDLCYTDTVAINLSGSDNNSNNVDDYIDEIDFFIDYNSKIKINVGIQAIFMKDNTVLDSLFLEKTALDYSYTDDISTIPPVVVTDRRLKNVLRANQMVLRLGASTDINPLQPGQPQDVQMMDTDAIFMRMRILTKTSEFDNN